jgi:hypothetical protein
MTTELASRRALLRLARGAIVDLVGGSGCVVDTSLPILDERRGAFVTLTLHERLRGCIGRVEAEVPLRALIPDMARAAATSDPRFAPVARNDVDVLVIEVSLLSAPESIDPRHVDVGRHGLIVSARGRRGLLLPQVPLQFGWSREEFLDEVCVKAGLPPDAWRTPGTRLQSFTAEVFSEGDDE